MRVLHVAGRLGERGGADVCLAGLLEAQRDRLDLHLAVGQAYRNARVPCALTEVPGLQARTRVAVALDPVVDEVRPDRIHVHNVVNPAVLEWAADHDAVMTVQDHRFFCPGRGKWTADGGECRESMQEQVCSGCFADESYFRAMLGLTAERLAALQRLHVIVLSQYMKRELAAVGVRNERITVIPPFVHGLDPDAEPDGPTCVLFVGRLVEAKGAPEALEAWRRSGLRLPLVFAGTGPLRASIEAAGGRVSGWVPHRRMSGLYRRAAVVVMPSRWQEPFGIVGLEALTLGTPVAAWDGGGVAEWHPGEPGLVPWGDVDGLARAMESLIGCRPPAPRGFERDPLTRRVQDVYARSTTSRS